MGARIEIASERVLNFSLRVAPLVGARIEMFMPMIQEGSYAGVAPLVGARIEIGNKGLWE